MARGKAKTTQEKLAAAIERRENLQAELSENKKEISRLEEQLKREQMDELVSLVENSGLTIEQVMDLIENNRSKLDKAI